MVDYLTKETLRRQAGPLNEQATVVRKAQDRSPAGATFLSHSTKDADLIPGVIALLERHGAVVYVDKKDETLPPFTSREDRVPLGGVTDGGSSRSPARAGMIRSPPRAR